MVDLFRRGDVTNLSPSEIWTQYPEFRVVKPGDNFGRFVRRCRKEAEKPAESSATNNHGTIMSDAEEDNSWAQMRTDPPVKSDGGPRALLCYDEYTLKDQIGSALARQFYKQDDNAWLVTVQILEGTDISKIDIVRESDELNKVNITMPHCNFASVEDMKKTFTGGTCIAQGDNSGSFGDQAFRMDMHEKDYFYQIMLKSTIKTNGDSSTLRDDTPGRWTMTLVFPRKLQPKLCTTSVSFANGGIVELPKMFVLDGCILAFGIKELNADEGTLNRINFSPVRTMPQTTGFQ